MRPGSLLASFALFASVAGAQAPATSNSLAASTMHAEALQLSSSAGCPIGMEARHAQQGAVVNVSPGQKRPEQSYRITFTPGMMPGVAQARITLHGLSGRYVVPAGGGGDASADATESFDLSPSPDPEHRFHSTIYIKKLTGVVWIELNELTYSNGTSWREPSDGSCRISPNGYMLVSAGK